MLKNSTEAIPSKNNQDKESIFLQQRAKKAQQQKLERLEKHLDKLSAQLDAIEKNLSDATIYSSENKIKLTKILEEQKQLMKKIQQTEQEWISVVDQF